MRFADPYLLALLALIPLLLLLKGRRRSNEAGASFSTLSLLAAYQATWRIRYRWLPTAVRALALALVVFALARPQTGQAESLLPGQGIDVALVLDTSSSMATDFGGSSRLESAQRVITDFISGREEDRLGLVIFQEQSLVLSPLTLDYEALTRLVADVERINLRDGTAIGTGLGEALNLLRESTTRSRVVVLLTDGENNAGTVEPAAAARIAETLGIRLYTIGLVDSRGRASGQVNVDEQALREMAEVTGGRYFPAESEQALAAIYESIDGLEKSRVGRSQFGAYNELAVYFLAAALLMLALELALRVTVWRRSA
jgi:Ca-activated chloride channel family protein